MKKKMSLVFLIMAVAVSTAVMTDSVSAFQSGPKASGHGNLGLDENGSPGGDEELRTFSFHANTDRDGVVIGSFVLNNRFRELFVRADIDCMVIENNIAYMSGIVTNTNTPIRMGQRAFVRVEDNGEGNNAPADRISGVNFADADAPIDCTILFPGQLFEIDGGNIQVKP